MDLILMEASALLLLVRRGAHLDVSPSLAAFRIFNPETFVRSGQVERNAGADETNLLEGSRRLAEESGIPRTAHGRRGAKIGQLWRDASGERKEFYHAAALLLYAGHPAARVADVLDISLAQVEMVRELQKMIAAENPLDAAHESQWATTPVTKLPKRKNPAARPANLARPILLTDIVEPQASLSRRRPTGGDEWGSGRSRTDETFVACYRRAGEVAGAPEVKEQETL